MYGEERQQFLRQIVAITNKKGWDFYRRGPAGILVPTARVIVMGPAQELEEEIIFELHPRIPQPATDATMRTFYTQHRIETPAIILSGVPIKFQGIEPREDEVRLICLARTLVPYPVFLAALETLQDLTQFGTAQ